VTFEALLHDGTLSPDVQRSDRKPHRRWRSSSKNAKREEADSSGCLTQLQRFLCGGEMPLNVFVIGDGLLQGDKTAGELPPIGVFKRKVYQPFAEGVEEARGTAIFFFASATTADDGDDNCCASPVSTTVAKSIIALDLLSRGLKVENISCPQPHSMVVTTATDGDLTQIEPTALMGPAGETYFLVKLQCIYTELRVQSPRSHNWELFLCRLAMSCQRDKRGTFYRLPTAAKSDGIVKPLPSADQGLSVFEFFSGIGGMRLALPRSVHGLPITKITAFDCADTVNDVYDYNFHNGQPLDSCFGGVLKRSLIDGLRVEDVDGKCDIWTMSPPCQVSVVASRW